MKSFLITPKNRADEKFISNMLIIMKDVNNILFSRISPELLEIIKKAQEEEKKHKKTASATKKP